MNVAVILSAGSGERFDKGTPKQFFDLNGKPIINYSFELFQNTDDVDCFIVVSRKDLITKTKSIADMFSKCRGVIEGGERRQDSVFNALEWIDKNIKNCKKVVIHDSARPVPGNALIKRLFDASEKNSSVIPIIESDDTLKQKDGEFVAKTLDRNSIVRVQTPQVFDFHLLFDCYQKLPKQTLATDDAFLIEHFGHKVFCVEGEKFNIKVTYPSDIKLLQTFFKEKFMAVSVSGIGYDSHKLVSGRKLILGGVEISKDFGALGHSDADVVCHAVIDAVLGASGKPDIGVFFPDTDPKWKDASSLNLLNHVAKILKGDNDKVVFVDVVVILESIKLRPHIEAMKSNISKALGIDVSRVNIKAKTNEGMGFLGRGEGVAVFASATVERNF